MPYHIYIKYIICIVAISIDNTTFMIIEYNYILHDTNKYLYYNLNYYTNTLIITEQYTYHSAHAHTTHIHKHHKHIYKQIHPPHMCTAEYTRKHTHTCMRAQLNTVITHTHIHKHTTHACTHTHRNIHTQTHTIHTHHTHTHTNTHTPHTCTCAQLNTASTHTHTHTHTHHKHTQHNHHEHKLVSA